MRILYLLYFDIDNPDQIGVNNKIRNQVEAFKELGHDVTLASCRDSEFCLERNDRKVTNDIRYGFTHYRGAILKLFKKGLYKKFDAVYIRYPGSIDYSLFSTFKFLSNKGIKVILEMPTYPIGGELISFLKELWENRQFKSLFFYGSAYGLHMILSRKMKPYVSTIVTFMPYTNIWGIETMQIDNGVDTDKCKVVNKEVRQDNKIVLILVARVSIWHGVDRVIKGITEYYENDGKENIELRIVGDSPLCEELKTLTNSLYMDDHVLFLGPKYDSELYDEYCQADIAIGSLGMHRINVLHGSTLKVKEYCSFGIPFILGYKEKKIDTSFKYALNIVADDSPLDINKVIAFYENIRMDSDSAIEMHNFAEENYKWAPQLKQLFLSL